MHRIGIDLGGTKIEGVVLAPDGRELFRKRVPTERDRGYQHILDKLVGLHAELVAAAGGAPTTFGIGTPGVISRHTGLMRNSNTVCMNGQPVKADLERLINRPVEMQNDANCFALAEAVLGAGRGKELVFGVIIGTGCGGGIVHHGRTIPGLQGIGGEWGHHSIDPNGPQCFCGHRGCVETFISGGGLENRYQEKFGVRRPLKEVERDYFVGEPGAVAFMNEFFDRFGRALANLIDILDPDLIVLGGGVSNFSAVYTEGIARVRYYALTDSLETPIVKHQLGDSAGVLGAALIGI